MSKTYIAANGQEITDEMINAWCEAYEQGEFPEGEHTVGPVVHGHQPLSAEGSAVLSVKVPVAMKRAIEREAAAQGISASAYARSAIADKLIAAG